MTVTVHRILDLMEAYGTTNAFVARLIGKDRTTVSMWKAGKASPTSKDISIIAQHYGVSSAYLTGESDDPGHAPEPTPAQRQLLSLAETLTNEELQKTLEYAAFLKSQRGK
ncbi:helix-turn-helix domain-containing protein [Ruthenibacterium lactatiformans]|uniref:helix-turn-helix domain-containing protein n=1 Tax=Ruthenibacterium lactatiformans TaxID=1550024 RepID=UPI003AEF663A